MVELVAMEEELARARRVRACTCVDAEVSGEKCDPNSNASPFFT